MRIVLELRDGDGTLVDHFAEDNTLLNVRGRFDEVRQIRVELEGFDMFVADHLDEIVAIAAAGVAWRDNMRQPHLTREQQVASFKEFMRYSTVLDTVSDELRGWLLMRKSKTDVKIMDGG